MSAKIQVKTKKILVKLTQTLSKDVSLYANKLPIYRQNMQAFLINFFDDKFICIIIQDNDRQYLF